MYHYEKSPRFTLPQLIHEYVSLWDSRREGLLPHRLTSSGCIFGTFHLTRLLIARYSFWFWKHLSDYKASWFSYHNLCWNVLGQKTILKHLIRSTHKLIKCLSWEEVFPILMPLVNSFSDHKSFSCFPWLEISLQRCIFIYPQMIFILFMVRSFTAKVYFYLPIDNVYSVYG